MNRKISAICLLSGGLDSILAAKIIQNQTIECIGLHFTSPFFQNQEGVIELINKHAKWLDIPLIIKTVGPEYFEMLKKPKYDYGKGLNPCTDCHTYFLKEASKVMNEHNASFIVTGDVFGQRSNSQLKKQLLATEEDSGMKGLIVRPLSGKFMEETIAEKEGWIQRESLFNFHGKGKKLLKKLADNYGIKEYSSLSGGCLLTEKGFSLKIKDLLDHNTYPKNNEISLLKIGRHFRYGEHKIVLGRNSSENEILAKEAEINDVIIEIEGCGSPMALLKYPFTKEALVFAAQLAGVYSDSTDKSIIANCKTDKEKFTIEINQISIEDVNKYNISLMNFDAKKNLI